jgi:Tol biopolymer transport system component
MSPSFPAMNSTVNSDLVGSLVMTCDLIKVCALDLSTDNQLRILTPDCTGVCTSPAVSPAGDWVVFDQSALEDSTSLWRVKTSGMDMQPIIQNEGIWLMPTWSPTESSIAFLSLEEPYLPPNSTLRVYRWASLYTVKPDGTGMKRLTPREGRVLDFDWAPDGERLVVSARLEDLDQDGMIDQADRARLYIVQLTSGEIQPVLTDVAPSLSMHKPAWSPASDYIAYIEGHGHLEAYGDLIVVDAADGSEIDRIDIDAAAAYSWSPDGTEIAYVGATMVDIGRYADLFVFDLTTGKTRRLTDTSIYSIHSSYHQGGIALYYPVWSPDGHYIAFVWRTSDKEYIVVVSAAGSSLSRVAGPGQYRLFAWTE